MSNDPQSKPQSRTDNVVSLNRHEPVANIEQTLATARRLFSLQEYVPCEELVLQVLSLDPHNAKAKALLELTSIKLSKRKLYKKIVEPRISGEPPKVDESAETRTEDASLSSQSPTPSTIHSESLRGGPIEGTEPPGRRTSQKGPLLKSNRSQGSGSRVGDAPPTDTVRERTINALVGLLKDKGKTLEWKDVRSPSPPSPQQQEEVGKSDFLSGSLIDLFESVQGKSAESLPGLSTNRKPSTVSLPKFSKTKAPDKQLSHKGSRSEGTETPASSVEIKPEVGLQNEAARKYSEPKAQRSLSQLELKSEHVKTATPPTGGQPEALLEHANLTPGVTINAPQAKTEKAPPPLAPQVSGVVDTGSQDRIPSKVADLQGLRFFDQIFTPSKPDYKQLMEKKLEERSEEIKNSEIKTVSIAQIKKYLYQEQYELCSREVERIRVLFPQNAEIQAFVENTSKRLTELQRIKAFEARAKDLMFSAVTFYQEGKLTEALIAVKEVLRVNPDHRQAREFIDFVERRMKKKKKEIAVVAVRYCHNCGTTVDSVSVFCFHCGKQL